MKGQLEVLDRSHIWFLWSMVILIYWRSLNLIPDPIIEGNDSWDFINSKKCYWTSLWNASRRLPIKVDDFNYIRINDLLNWTNWFTIVISLIILILELMNEINSQIKRFLLYMNNTEFLKRLLEAIYKILNKFA